MTEHLKRKRLNRIKRATVIAILLIGVTALSKLTNAPAGVNAERMGLAVIPDFTTVRAEAARINIITADETYALVNSEAGWQMNGADGYAVRPDRLAALVTGLQTLQWGEGRTRDPEKFDHIGLGDPREGGTGALIQILNDSGAIQAELITGRKNTNIYARYPTDLQAYRVTGELPPLYTHDAWLDLDIIDINADAVSAVRIFDSSGDSLFLQRVVGASERSFRPAPPYQNYRLVSRIAASTPALALTRLQPIGVKRASDLTTPPAGRHITQTHDGLEVDLHAYKEPDGYFVTLRAIEAGEGARRGSTINEKAEGWALELNEYDWNDFTPRVNAIVRPGPVNPEEAP